MRRAVPAVIALLLLAGCGDDEETTTTTTTGATGATGATGPVEPVDQGERDGGQGASPEVAITQNIKGALGGRSLAQACDVLVTERYLRDAYGGQQGCRDAQAAEGAFDVRVRQIEIDGDRATAVAVPKGGPNEGIETDVELVRDGEVWKVDRLRADVPAGP